MPTALRERDELDTAQAERLLEMAEKGYTLGVKIRLDVADAELNLIRAQGNLARAQHDHFVAWVLMGILGEAVTG